MMSGQDSLSKIAAAIEIQRVWRGYCVRYVCTCMECVFVCFAWISIFNIHTSQGQIQDFWEGVSEVGDGLPLKVYQCTPMAVFTNIKCVLRQVWCMLLMQFMDELVSYTISWQDRSYSTLWTMENLSHFYHTELLDYWSYSCITL